MNGNQVSRDATEIGASIQSSGLDSRSPWREVFSFAPLWGVIGCVGFYALLPYVPFQRELLVRYCTSHPLEYITMFLFFLGMATILIRRRDLSLELSSLRRMQGLVNDVSRQRGASRESKEGLLESLFQSAHPGSEDTVAGRRLQEALRYHRDNDSTERMDEHLRHISDLESDRAHQQFGFINTITWAVPILGFLGTVMGITLAIANVTPDQLDKSLPEVTGGLAVAFDTTALSLSLSLVLVFGTFMVRRKQDEILSNVDRHLDPRLCSLLKKTTSSSPLRDHEHISSHLVEASAQIVAEATALWRRNLTDLENSFAESLQAEQLRVADVLQSGMSRSLEAQQSHFEALRESEVGRNHLVANQMEQALQRWETSLENVSRQYVHQSRELGQHTELIVALLDKQQELITLQQQIQESLDAHRIASTLDQTLNSLTAAIQLLNARVHVSQRAA